MVIQTLVYVCAALFLIAGIWNVIALKEYPFWLQLMKWESQIFNKEWNGGDSFTLFNVLLMLTTLTNCMIYFITGIVCMQTCQAQSMTTAVYFQSTLKFGIAGIIACSGLTLIFGAVLIGETLGTTLLILYIVQVMLFLSVQLGLMIYALSVSSKLVASLKDFHAFLSGYRQTPRSRIFKKNLPVKTEDGFMEPILEAESFLEHSLLSGSKIMQPLGHHKSIAKSIVSRKSIMSTRFVYDENLKQTGCEMAVDENDKDVGIVEFDEFNLSIDSFNNQSAPNDRRVSSSCVDTNNASDKNKKKAVGMLMTAWDKPEKKADLGAVNNSGRSQS